MRPSARSASSSWSASARGPATNHPRCLVLGPPGAGSCLRPPHGGSVENGVGADDTLRHPLHPVSVDCSLMPLLDSGDALFAGSSAEFAAMAPASRLTEHLVAAFIARW